ncbi:dihydrodipicolinate synthase family protein, partial [Streptomyces sp. LS1784]
MELKGIHIPLITPFAADGSVALDALEKLAHEVLDAGAAGLVALGTTGEPAALTAEERDAVVDVAAAACAARGAQLTVGASGGDTRAVG